MPVCFAGAARRDITPPLGRRLAGNPVDRPGAAVRIDSPLYARVLSLRSGRERVLLIALDLLAVDRAFAADLRREVAARHGIAEAAVMVWATHTHGGPAGLLRDLGGLDGPPDQALLAQMKDAVLGAIEEALRLEAPAKVGIGQGEVTGVGANRRAPDGPMNSMATVLRVDRMDDSPLAFLIHYTCHPTLGNFELAYTADYPGYAVTALEAAAAGAVGLFANGAAGDISTRFTRHGLGDDEARRIGTVLAQGTGSIYRSIVPVPELRLAYTLEQTDLKTRQFPLPEELRVMEEQAEAALAAGKRQGLAPAAQRVLDINLVGARMARMFAAALSGDAVPADIQALSIGELTLVGVPGELFVESGLQVTEAQSGPAVLVGFAGGYTGYLMPPDEWEAGGYEALTALVEPQEVVRLVGLARDACRRLNT